MPISENELTQNAYLAKHKHICCTRTRTHIEELKRTTLSGLWKLKTS